MNGIMTSPMILEEVVTKDTGHRSPMHELNLRHSLPIGDGLGAVGDRTGPLKHGYGAPIRLHG